MCVKEVFVNFYILSLTTWTLDKGEGLFYLVLSGSAFYRLLDPGQLHP